MCVTEGFSGTDTDWAWAAGIFEGEGCTSFAIENGRCYPRLRVGMTDEDVVRRFHRVVGRGRVYGPYRDDANPHYKARYVWCAARQVDVAFIVSMLWPYLGERRRATIMGDPDGRVVAAVRPA